MDFICEKYDFKIDIEYENNMQYMNGIDANLEILNIINSKYEKELSFKEFYLKNLSEFYIEKGEDTEEVCEMIEKIKDKIKQKELNLI